MVISSPNPAACSRWLWLLALIFASSVTLSASAQEDAVKTACLQAFTDTQSLRDAGKLLAAREQALACSSEQCPDVINTKCKTWQREIDESTPAIVVRVIDESGRDTAEATLSVDGNIVKQRLDGLPIALDPGEHFVAATLLGKPSRVERVVLTAGDKQRQVVLSYAPEATAPKVAPRRGTHVHVLTYVGFGLAGAGLIAGAITGGLSMARTADLETACPTQQCTEAERDLHDEATLLSHVATASFAVAGAGAILGAIGLFALSDGIFGPAEARSKHNEIVVGVGLGTMLLSGRF